jgi:hypothetical protein
MDAMPTARRGRQIKRSRPDGRVDHGGGRCGRAKVTALRTPAIGSTKYSIIPLVTGRFTSNRDSSLSQTKSMPARSCVWMTTRVASITACSDGSAASQSGDG